MDMAPSFLLKTNKSREEYKHLQKMFFLQMKIIHKPTDKWSSVMILFLSNEFFFFFFFFF